MDYELMLQQHVAQGADVTAGCLEVPRQDASSFGVMDIDQDDNIRSFLERPADPPGMPGKPDISLASMGIYVFDTDFLIEQLRRDAAEPSSSHDFGKDVIPYIVHNGKEWPWLACRSDAQCTEDSDTFAVETGLGAVGSGRGDAGSCSILTGTNEAQEDVLTEIPASWPARAFLSQA